MVIRFELMGTLIEDVDRRFVVRDVGGVGRRADVGACRHHGVVGTLLKASTRTGARGSAGAVSPPQVFIDHIEIESLCRC